MDFILAQRIGGSRVCHHLRVSAPLLVVDGDNLAHRAYHSTPKTVIGVNGKSINAVVGFFSMLSRIWSEEKPRGVFVAWDTLGVDTYRNELWPPYQGGRIFEPSIVEQLGWLPDLCRSFAFGVGKAAGFEADDLVASAVQSETEISGKCLILTTDKDTYQLASDTVTIISPKRGTRELERIGPIQVVEKFGVLPQQVPDFKALSGDPSDKIPGLPGIGPKSAAALLLKYGTLENVLMAWSKADQVELALKFREVARMRPDVQVILPLGAPDWVTGAEVLRKLGAGNLADRLAALA
jgi:DNA polymerase-1